MMMLPPDKLDRASAEVAEENGLFRTFLKGRSAAEVDDIVHGFHQDLFGSFDCVTCSNCCKVIAPVAAGRLLMNSTAQGEAGILKKQLRQ
ncbi:MAG: hypothetical protein AB1767_04865 [Bacillota bacterium]